MEQYRTNDMSLAAYLTMHGHLHQRMDRRNGRECVWVFLQSEPLRRLVEGFLGGNAQVEPKTYLQEVSAIRREMYNFLDVEIQA